MLYLIRRWHHIVWGVHRSLRLTIHSRLAVAEWRRPNRALTYKQVPSLDTWVVQVISQKMNKLKLQSLLKWDGMGRFFPLLCLVHYRRILGDGGETFKHGQRTQIYILQHIADRLLHVCVFRNQGHIHSSVELPRDQDSNHDFWGLSQRPTPKRENGLRGVLVITWASTITQSSSTSIASAVGSVSCAAAAWITVSCAATPALSSRSRLAAASWSCVSSAAGGSLSWTYMSCP